MELSVTRRLSFNLGRYEQQDITVTITGIPGDTEPEDIAVQLGLLAGPEIARARLATCHAREDNVTSVYTWDDIAQSAKEDADA